VISMSKLTSVLADTASMMSSAPSSYSMDGDL
jgi:hypothetical protein